MRESGGVFGAVVSAVSVVVVAVACASVVGFTRRFTGSSLATLAVCVSSISADTVVVAAVVGDMLRLATSKGVAASALPNGSGVLGGCTGAGTSAGGGGEGVVCALKPLCRSSWCRAGGVYECVAPGVAFDLPLFTGGEGLNGGTKRSSSFLSCNRFCDSSRRCCCWCSRFLMRKIFGILRVVCSFRQSVYVGNFLITLFIFSLDLKYCSHSYYQQNTNPRCVFLLELRATVLLYTVGVYFRKFFLENI